MQWTTTPPIATGHYWQRYTMLNVIVLSLVYVSTDIYGTPFMLAHGVADRYHAPLGSQWLGPLFGPLEVPK